MTSCMAGRVALVTGAGSGIGRALALRLACEGASVVLVGRDPAKLRAVIDEVPSLSHRMLPLPVDLTRQSSDERVVELLAATHGSLDVLVHSAGIFTQGSIPETTRATLREQLETNAVAPYAVTRALLPMLALASGGGQVVFINSSVVGARRAGIAAYGASKAAVAAVANAVREEVNPRGVRVLSVFVGRTATPMQERIHAHEQRAYDPAALLQPEDVAGMVVAALALPGTAEVTDLHIRPMRRPDARPLPPIARSAS